MRIKTFLAAVALMAAPGFALAQGGCNYGAAYEANISCAAGTTWDAATEACVPTVSS